MTTTLDLKLTEYLFVGPFKIMPFFQCTVKSSKVCCTTSNESVCNLDECMTKDVAVDIMSRLLRL